MSHIAAARPRAEARLGSTCTITRAGEGDGTWDRETLEQTAPPPVPVWAGPCSVAPDANQGREDERGGQEVAGRRFTVAVPVAAVGMARGDILTVDSVDEDGDPMLVGVPLTIVETVIRSNVVLRRLRCVDTSTSSATLP